MFCFFVILLGKWNVSYPKMDPIVPYYSKVLAYTIWSAWICLFSAWKNVPNIFSQMVVRKWWFDMVQSKNRGTPRMVKIMENPMKMDHLGEPPLFSERSIWYNPLWTNMSLSLPPDFLVRFISGGTREEASFCYFLSKRYLHQVANSSNKRNKFNRSPYWSSYIFLSDLFGWQSQPSPQSTSS